MTAAEDKEGAEFLAWRDRRDRVVLNLDVDALQKDGTTGERETLLISLHKSRYEITTMPEELRHASRAWLEEHGYSRLGRLPWPTDGSLPE